MRVRRFVYIYFFAMAEREARQCRLAQEEHRQFYCSIVGISEIEGLIRKEQKRKGNVMRLIVANRILFFVFFLSFFLPFPRR